MGENLSTKDFRDRLYGGFKDKTCEKCFETNINKVSISQPDPIPYIGPNFQQDKHRLMFIGIETYCNDPRKSFSQTEYGKFPTETIKEYFINRSVSDSKERKTYSPFWGWVNSISTDILSPGNPEEAFTRIAYTNLNKCQSRKKDASEEDFCESNYRITEEMSRNCIQKQKWVFKEITAKEVDAKNIVVFAGRKDNYMLARLFLGSDEDTPLKKFIHKDGSRKGVDLFMHLKAGDRRIIVTNHPQITPDDIRCEIVRIIKNNVWDEAVDWKIPI